MIAFTAEEIRARICVATSLLKDLNAELPYIEIHLGAALLESDFRQIVTALGCGTKLTVYMPDPLPDGREPEPYVIENLADDFYVNGIAVRAATSRPATSKEVTAVIKANNLRYVHTNFRAGKI